ncbi:MAG: hypothetical protein ACO20H_00315 [Bacteriovoracaceae bacterium]
MIPQSVYLFLLIELVAVSYLDILHRKISNLWPLLNIIIFIIVLTIVPDVYNFELKQFFYSIAFLIVGFTLFILKIMGPGDTKFLFSFFILIPVSQHETAFLGLLYLTILMGSSLFLYNSYKNIEKIKEAFKRSDTKIIKEIYGSKFPYAPVILLSWIWFGWVNRKILF